MKLKCIIFFFAIFGTGFSQETVENILKIHNSKLIPYIQVEDLKKNSNYIILDTRETNEYKTSHLSNAVNIGYKNFKSSTIKSIVKNKNSPIVVYCSLGIRSEKIGNKLQKMGYTNVQNLYGGIFEWKNKGNIVVDSTNVVTQNVHTFSKQWRVYLKSGVAIYEK